MQVPSSIKNLNTMANETAMRSLSTHDKKRSQTSTNTVGYRSLNEYVSTHTKNIIPYNIF